MKEKGIFIESILKSTSNSLPGWDAQRLMAPPYREIPDINKIMASNPKQSAVAILLYEKESIWYTSLIQRSEYKGVHSNQISFPGGKNEADETWLQTAIRECNEEIGIALHESQFINCLSPVYIPPSHFIVYPHLFYYPEAPHFTIDSREVQHIIELPVHILLNENNKQITPIQISNGTPYQVPAYHFNTHIIWGATAVMLSELEHILRMHSVTDEL